MNIEQLRDFCLALPHTTEDVKWGNDLCFCIAEKMYCATRLEGEFALSFKVPPHEFDELTQRVGIIPAPYLARYKWVYVKRSDALSHQEFERFVKQSYQLVKSKLPKKIQDQLGD